MRAPTSRLAYRIREGLAIPSNWPSRFPELARYAKGYAITTPRPGRVEAIMRPERIVSVSAVKTHGSRPHGQEPTQVRLTSAQAIIDSWQAHLPSNDAINFKQTSLPYDELKRLFHWAQANAPKLMILAADNTLTLALYEIGVGEHSWHPKPDPEPEESLNL